MRPRTLASALLALCLALPAYGQEGSAPAGDGSTPLHWAAYRDDLAKADQLIRGGANVNAANDLGVTPLWAASTNGSPALVKRLLDAGANPNTALFSGETPLMVAARSGKAAAVELLLARDANPNARGTRGQTALMWAVAQGHVDVVKLLVAGKADIHAKSESWSQMMAVPPHGLPEYNRMIPHGADTALMFAARNGELASAKVLVDAGANVNDEDAWGVSATTLAAFSGFGELARYLLEKGADPNADKAGFTALHCAIMRRDEETAGTPSGEGRQSERHGEGLDTDASRVRRLPLHAGARRRDPVLAGRAVYRAWCDAPARQTRCRHQGRPRIELRAGRGLPEAA